jgi:hypothetical protein
MPQLTQKLRDEILAISDPVLRGRWQRYFAIPTDLQKTLFDQVFADKIGEIIKEKYQLGYENMTRVAKIIGLIFLGELPVKNFITALKDELGVDIQKAQAIAQDINISIFQPVRESLMQVHGLAERGLARNETRADAENPQKLTPPTPPENNQQVREELVARLKSQQSAPPAMQPSPVQPKGSPYQARPAQYFVAPRKNIIDLRTNKRKNSNRRKYNGFFADY